MEDLLKEILAELKAIRLILAPNSANNAFKLLIVPEENSKNGDDSTC